MNAQRADDLLPDNLDIPALQSLFVGKFVTHVNPPGVKEVSEIDVVVTVQAIAMLSSAPPVIG